MIIKINKSTFLLRLFEIRNKDKIILQIKYNFPNYIFHFMDKCLKDKQKKSFLHRRKDLWKYPKTISILKFLITYLIEIKAFTRLLWFCLLNFI